MGILAELPSAISWLAGGVLLIVFAYGVARAASYAFFRTKLEYLRSALRELRKERNGHG